MQQGKVRIPPRVARVPKPCLPSLLETIHRFSLRRPGGEALHENTENVSDGMLPGP